MMSDVCRNCGRLAGLPSCMCWNAHGTFCETCHLSRKIEPPFDISESEYQAKVSLHKALN